MELILKGLHKFKKGKNLGRLGIRSFFARRVSILSSEYSDTLVVAVIQISERLKSD